MKRSLFSHRCARSHRPSSRRGFTLVELLVVIGIIALLISILLPSLNRARQSAKTVVCLSHLKSIGQAVALYTNDNKGTLPYGYWNGLPMAPANEYGFNGAQAADWTVLIKASLDGTAGTNYNDDAVAGGADNGTNEVFFCPEANASGTIAGQTYMHYSTNPRLMPVVQRADGFSPGKFLKPYKIGAIRDNAEKVLVFEGSLKQRVDNGTPVGFSANATGERIDAYRIAYGTYLVNAWDKFQQEGMDPIFTGPGYSIDIGVYDGGGSPQPQFNNTDTEENWGNIRYRHNGEKKANVLFVDGHAASTGFTSATDVELTRGNVYVGPQ